MGKILIIYDSESDRKFTSTMVPLVKEGIERVDGTSPALRRQHAALSTFSDFPGIRIEAVSHTD